MTELEKYIQEYDFTKNLIIVWKTWVGKTHQMKYLYNKLPKNWDWVLQKYWIDDGQIREFINSWMFSLRPPECYSQSITWYAFEMCIRVKVLFLDDFWASSNISDAQKTKIKYILDERSKQWLVNIISTNLSAREVAEMYWERIKSRVFDWKSWEWLDIITIEWEDRRKENIKTLKFK